MTFNILAPLQRWFRFGTMLFMPGLIVISHPAQGMAAIVQDAGQKRISLSDEQGRLTMIVNYDNGCTIDSVSVLGRAVTMKRGVYTGIDINGERFTSKTASIAGVTVDKNTASINNIKFGPAGQEVQETWTFITTSDCTTWKISRRYSAGEILGETAFPEWNFASMSIWTGGLLDNGGVVWSKYLDRPSATYGSHFKTVTFWNASSNDCLRITPHFPANLFGAGCFSRSTNDIFLFRYEIAGEPLEPQHGQSRFLSNRQDVWKPVHVQASDVTAEFALQALAYDKTYDRGAFVGLDGNNIRELLNTVARYGVIDSKLTGGNGWRSAYICLHEPFFAQIAAAVDSADYTANLSAFLDNARDQAIETNGRVKSRWCYGAWDAMPGTYDKFGFYEAQWGCLMDSQPDYVMNVVEQFNNTGDVKWLARHKDSCERALAFLTRREVGGTGLVAMMTDSHKQNRGSDWIDIIWAAYENAFVNAQLYAALNLWAEAETALNETNKAEEYHAFAARLKASFNKSTAEGGFWNPTNNWYVYWRDQDGSIHGNNLVTTVNFAAIAYGLCDDPARQRLILDRMETEMKKENLFYWPLSFFPYESDEGASGNFPFPKYENGDIFLSWGELGVRAYAAYNPALALKYVRNTLDRYTNDGLSYQRYLRQDQRGEGDDILAGNCMPIVGLYRDIYGIQPKPNRLYLEPHLTGELSGTSLRYELRGRPYEITLNTNATTVVAGNHSIQAAQPFGVSASETALQYFSGDKSDWALSVLTPKNVHLSVQIMNWQNAPGTVKEWTEAARQTGGNISHAVRGLKPNATYRLYVDGKMSKSLRADKHGQLKFDQSFIANEIRQLRLTETD